MGIRVRIVNLIDRRTVTGFLGAADPDAAVAALSTHITALSKTVTDLHNKQAGDITALSLTTQAELGQLSTRISALESAPPPEPEPWPHTSIQAVVDAAKAGDVIIIPAGVYLETVHLNKAVTLRGNPGAIIDGDGKREHGVIITASGATLAGFEVCYGVTARQRGMVQVQGCLDVTVRDCHIHDTTGACLSIIDATADVNNCDIHGSAYLGVHGWQAHHSIIQNCRIHDNQAAPDTLGWEHGGLKVSETNGLSVNACKVYANSGPGLWADINCEDWLVTHSRIYDNAGPAIFYEVSKGLTADNNVMYGNGHGSPGWNEGAAVRLANSAGCHIHDNIVAWNADGLTISQQNRTDWPGHQDVINNTFERNLVAIANPSARENVFGLAFVWDTTNGQRQWDHRGNRAYHAHPNGPWGFGGPDV